MARLRLAAMIAAPVSGSLAMCAASVKPQSWPSMSLPSDSPPCSDGAVRAVLNYQESNVKEVWTRRDTSGSDDTLHGAHWDLRELIIQDGRRKPLSLDSNGFELLRDPKARHPDYFNEEDVIGKYYPQCEELLKRVTGASLVAAFDHNVRSESGRASGRKIRGGNAVQGPAALVHGDYTAESAPRRLKLLGEQPKINDALRPLLGEKPLLEPAVVDAALEGSRRYAFVNVWRPISLVETKPLACADASTVRPDELVVFQIVYADRVGENYFAKWQPEHEWYYFPQMTPDEVMLIKQWDSGGDLAMKAGRGTSTFALHSAFADPTSPAGAKDRESIEVRCVLIW